MNNTTNTNNNEQPHTLTDEICTLRFDNWINGMKDIPFSPYSAEGGARFPVIKLDKSHTHPHDMVHGIGTRDGHLHILNSRATLQIRNRSVVLRLMGQSGMASKQGNEDGSTNRTFDVYAIVIERINDDGSTTIAFNATLPKADNSGIMRDIRDATDGNGCSLNSYDGNMCDVSRQIMRACMNPEVFDIYAPCNYDGKMNSNDVRSLRYKLGHGLESHAYRDPIEYDGWVTAKTDEFLNGATCKELEDFNPISYESSRMMTPNYSIDKWDDDKITMSSGIAIPLKKEAILTYINSGYDRARQVYTSYGNIQKVDGANLMKCGCHYIDLDEVKTHLGIEFTPVNSNTTDQVNGEGEETLLQILHRHEIDWKAKLSEMRAVDINADTSAVRDEFYDSCRDKIDDRLTVVLKRVGLVKRDRFNTIARSGFDRYMSNQKQANRPRIEKIQRRAQRTAFQNYLAEFEEVNDKIRKENDAKALVSRRFGWIDTLVFDYNQQPFMPTPTPA